MPRQVSLGRSVLVSCCLTSACSGGLVGAEALAIEGEVGQALRARRVLARR